MGKKIELPWTCDTGDKIKNALKWCILISLPVSLILFFLWAIKVSGQTQFNGFDLVWFIFGFFGTAFSWLIQIVVWNIDGKFPTFSCKQPNRKED